MRTGNQIFKINASDAKPGNEFKAELYTSETGYKLVLTVGVHQNKSLSNDANVWISLLYLQIRIGEYDALLTWPFNIPVRFVLFDQRDEVLYDNALNNQCNNTPCTHKFCFCEHIVFLLSTEKEPGLDSHQTL